MSYYYIFFLLIVVGLILAARLITVLFHELGHAIPAIILKRQKVTIYIGSYGDAEKSLRLSLFKLEIFFRYNPFYGDLDFAFLRPMMFQ